MSFLLEFLQHALGEGKPFLGCRGPSLANSHEGCWAKIWPLSSTMRKEMEKGTVYNMKVVLRGMRRVGKSTLLARLGGHPLPSAYKASMEITATTMYFLGEGCASHEGTRVDVWDVVDSGESTPNTTPAIPSSLHNKDQLELCLKMVPSVSDARSIDVYCRCHLAIFLIDSTRPTTLDYAVQEAQHVPHNCCIVFALSFIDMPEEKRRIDLDDVAAACKQLRRTMTSFVSQIAECHSPPPSFSIPALAVSISARTGAGIDDLLECFNAPNKLLRIAALEQRLQGLYGDVMTAVLRNPTISPHACQPAQFVPSSVFLSHDKPQGRTSGTLNTLKENSPCLLPSSLNLDEDTQDTRTESFVEGVSEDRQIDAKWANFSKKGSGVSTAIVDNHSFVTVAEFQEEQISTPNVLNQVMSSVNHTSHPSSLRVKSSAENIPKVEANSSALDCSSSVSTSVSCNGALATAVTPFSLPGNVNITARTTDNTEVATREKLLLDAVQDRSAPWEDFFGAQIEGDEVADEEDETNRSLDKSAKLLHTNSDSKCRRRLLVSEPLFSNHLSSAVKISPPNSTQQSGSYFSRGNPPDMALGVPAMVAQIETTLISTSVGQVKFDGYESYQVKGFRQSTETGNYIE